MNLNIENYLSFLTDKTTNTNQTQENKAVSDNPSLSEFIQELREMNISNNSGTDEIIINKALEPDLEQNSTKTFDDLTTGEIFQLCKEFDINTGSLCLHKNYNLVSTEIKEDVNKLIYAKETGKTIEEVFVPKFESNEDAIKNLNSGEVFQLNNSNKISIKLSDGSVKELNLTPEKYLELFPPVEKYSLKQGSNTADCYLVSVLDSIIKTPNGFAQILECFNEYEDGSVSVKFPNGKSSFILEAGETLSENIKTAETSFMGQITSYSTNPEDYISKSSTGIQMLEHLYGLEILKEKVNGNENSQQLINELNAEEQDIAKIAELHHYYEEELNDGSEATKLRGSGGSEDTVYELFKINNNLSQDRDDILNLMSDIDNTENIVFSAARFGKTEISEKLGIVGSHAYSIKPYKDEDGSVRCKVIDPYETSISKDLSLEDVKSVFSSIGATQLL